MVESETATTSLTLGKFTDGETISIENKEYHLKIEEIQKYLAKYKEFQIINTGILGYSDKCMLHYSILKYIHDTTPKYIACYANLENGINGQLNFGVSDEINEITGLPLFFPELFKKQLPRYICDSIKNNIQIDSNLSKREILKRIKIEFIPLKINLHLLRDDAERCYKMFQKKHREYQKKRNIWKKEQEIFIYKHEEYTQKLNYMLQYKEKKNKNDDSDDSDEYIFKYREELIHYMNNNASNPNIDLISLLKSNNKIILYKKNAKKNRNDPNTIFYWITRFRDSMTKKIRKNKPKKPLYPSIYDAKHILANASLMRYKYIKNNKDINYYIVRIHLNMKDIGHTVLFKNNDTGEFLKKTRVICSETNNAPGCMG